MMKKPRISIQFHNIISRRFQNNEYLKQERQSYFRAISIRNHKPNELSMSTYSYASHQAHNGSSNQNHFSLQLNSVRVSTTSNQPKLPSNFISGFVKKIFRSQAYHIFLHIIALLSMICTTLDSPVISPENDLIISLNQIEIFISTFYLVDIALKLIVLGPKFFFQQSFFNYIDFFNAIISLLLLAGVPDPGRYLKILKSLRVFRLIRGLFYLNKDLNIFGDCLIHSFIYVVKLIFFYGLFLLCFSLFAMKKLKGKLFHCVELGEVEKIHIKTKQDCFDFGGSWINSDTPFDNILIAFFTLFETSTTEGWSLIMFETTESIGIDFEPKFHSSSEWKVFFLIFFFIMKILLLNMFVGIIIENIMLMKSQAKKLEEKTKEQREWSLIKQNILNMVPKKRKKHYFSNIRLRTTIDFFTKRVFRIFFYLCIIANCIVICLFWHDQDEEMKEDIILTNQAFIYIFTFQFVIKILKNGPRFFKKKLNLYELLIIIVAYANIFLEIKSKEIHMKFTNPDFNLFRIFNAFAKGLQFTKLFSIFQKFQSLKQLTMTLNKTFPLFFGLLLFIVLILYMFAIIGMNRFAFLKTQSTINGIDAHFRTFSYSLYSLVRIASSEIYFKIVSDCVRQQAPNFVCYEISNYEDFVHYGYMGCGDTNGYVYFFFFHLLFSLIIFNVFIGSIISSYDSEHKAIQTAVSRYQLWDIQKIWFEFDPKGLGYISYKDFWRFSGEVALIYGVAPEEMRDLKSKKNFLKVLKIPIYLNKKENIFCYKFHDVIIELSKFAVALKYGVIKYNILKPFFKITL